LYRHNTFFYLERKKLGIQENLSRELGRRNIGGTYMEPKSNEE
jgi:hypothetical protein